MAAKRSGSGWASPERRKVWTEPNKPKTAAVVYYLCRQDGQLDHPHFLHVPLHHPPRPPGVGGALYLRDVIARLADLRGAAMPAAYSWSAKRAYRNNAYVWHDLADDDLILPAHADEYVLKGSPKLPPPAASARNRWTSFDRAPAPAEAEAEVAAIDGDMSPPPSSSSPDAPANNNNNYGDIAGRMRPSAMLMQLISCGSIPRRGPRSDLQQLARVHGDKMGMDRDYFSGSLVETTTTTTSKSKRPSDGPQLRRSSSCNGGGGTANRQRGGADNDCGGMR